MSVAAEEKAQNLTEILAETMAQKAANQTLLSKLSAAHDEVIATFGAFKDQIFAELPLVLTEFKEYVTHINWTEPFVLALVAFHISMLVVLFASRSRVVVQNTIFFLSVVIVFNAEKLNSFLSRNWHMFAREDYFDESGAFISLMVSLPLLLNMLIVLVNYAVMFMQTLVVMQREKLGLTTASGSKKGAAKKGNKNNKPAATPTRRSSRNKKNK